MLELIVVTEHTPEEVIAMMEKEDLKSLDDVSDYLLGRDGIIHWNYSDAVIEKVSEYLISKGHLKEGESC